MIELKMCKRISNVQYSPLIEHIGKIEVTKKTDHVILGALLGANPQTIKIDGEYS